jgi:hypothetical protein
VAAEAEMTGAAAEVKRFVEEDAVEATENGIKELKSLCFPSPSSSSSGGTAGRAV